ncbi:hypothetical protein B0H63DRAFT_66464 [Podospora didyma]|uniref:Secreted protein n=1 Tax=Podospora didyma TaxID=330526 RepID=A0AAE0P8G3_9PEZI|nr:hypothetical protein B0H63DRAFT_66464 [Podospora didyma]
MALRVLGHARLLLQPAYGLLATTCWMSTEYCRQHLTALSPSLPPWTEHRFLLSRDHDGTCTAHAFSRETRVADSGEPWPYPFPFWSGFPPSALLVAFFIVTGQKQQDFIRMMLRRSSPWLRA